MVSLRYQAGSHNTLSHHKSPEGVATRQYKPVVSGERLKSGPGTQPSARPAFPQGNRPARGEQEAISLQTLMSAALIHLRASPAGPRSWGRAIPPSFQRNCTSGTRMYGSRSPTVPPRASTAACDDAGTSDSGAARWRKDELRKPVEIRA